MNALVAFLASSWLALHRTGATPAIVSAAAADAPQNALATTKLDACFSLAAKTLSMNSTTLSSAAGKQQWNHSWKATRIAPRMLMPGEMTTRRFA